MNNVIECLESNFATAISTVKNFRRWAKEGDSDSKKSWDFAFRNLHVAKEFKKAISILKSSNDR